MKKSDFYIEKALNNIESDREKLEALYEELNRAGVNENTGESDPITRSAVSENLVKIVDSLTKQTGQVVELAKLKQKVEQPIEKQSDDEFTNDDKDDLYTQLEEKALKSVSDA